MPLPDSTKQKIRLAYEAGREVKRGASGSVTLRFGGGGLTYLVRQGKKTESGLFYEQLSNTELGETWDPNQIPTKSGRTDYTDQFRTESCKNLVANNFYLQIHKVGQILLCQKEV